MCVEVINGMADTIAELEQKLAEREWIPVTERLPKVQYGESKPVLVTECWKYDNGTSFAIRTAEYDGSVWHDGTGNVFTETMVIAWMPLPEPYRESEE